LGEPHSGLCRHCDGQAYSKSLAVRKTKNKLSKYNCSQFLHNSISQSFITERTIKLQFNNFTIFQFNEQLNYTAKSRDNNFE